MDPVVGPRKELIGETITILEKKKVENQLQLLTSNHPSKTAAFLCLVLTVSFGHLN